MKSVCIDLGPLQFEKVYTLVLVRPVLILVTPLECSL